MNLQPNKLGEYEKFSYFSCVRVCLRNYIKRPVRRCARANSNFGPFFPIVLTADNYAIPLTNVETN